MGGISMKVGSADALNNLVSRSKYVKDEIISSESMVLENKKIAGKKFSEMTENEKMSLPVSERVLLEAVEKATKAVEWANRRFEYSVHEKTKDIMIKVVDSETGEIIREIPPEKILDLVANLCEIAGLIIDERR